MRNLILASALLFAGGCAAATHKPDPGFATRATNFNYSKAQAPRGGQMNPPTSEATRMTHGY